MFPRALPARIACLVVGAAAAATPAAGPRTSSSGKIPTIAGAVLSAAFNSAQAGVQPFEGGANRNIEGRIRGWAWVTDLANPKEQYSPAGWSTDNTVWKKKNVLVG